MRSASAFRLVLVTAPDIKTARQLARAALKARLAACANLVPKMESHYWWQGEVEQSSEVLILFKTTATQLTALERLILEKHPYDTAEFLSLRLDRGTARYLHWLETEVQ